MTDRKDIDCLIVGGGPSGLTAALYLARYHRRVIVADAGRSRAALIPKSHNLVGFPDGIAGPDLLQRMRDHARRYGADLRQEPVTDIVKQDRGFHAQSDGAQYSARTVIIATGGEDVLPQAHNIHPAIAAGVVRLCPVCDAYEAGGKRIAVIGNASASFSKAILLRRYSDDVTFIAHAPLVLTGRDRKDLEGQGIAIAEGDFAGMLFETNRAVLGFGGSSSAFDVVYPALGSRVHSALAVRLGVDASEAGCIRVDDHQETSVPGLFAAGDVVLALDQIAVAAGQAAIAATTIHNRLCEIEKGGPRR